MKPFKFYLFAVTILLIGIIVAGCMNNEKVPENVVAVVNNEMITLEDIRSEIDNRDTGLRINAIIEEKEGKDNETPSDIVDELISKAKSEAEKRYYERMKRNLNNQNKKYTENDAFNQLVRKKVLYQEALSQGCEVTIDEARELRIKMDENSRKMLEEQGDIDELKKFQDLEAEAIKISGYKNREEWFEASLKGSSKSMTISRMKKKFIDYLMKKNPDEHGQEWIIYKSNSWEEYTEFLIKRAKIKIYKDNYTLQFYEKDWELGRI